MTQFSDAEVADVRARYPELEIRESGALEGTVNLEAEYKGRRITDRFLVRITASNPHSSRTPALFEIGGRTKAIASKYGIGDLRILHCNFDGTACVCVKQVEKEKFPPGATLLTYLEKLAIPYLYGLSCYDQDGSWPWGDYTHGPLGLLEYYAENRQEQLEADVVEVIEAMKRDPMHWGMYRKQLRSPSAKRSCPCGSNVAFGKCHTLAWRGTQHLSAEIRRLKLHHLIK